MSNPELATRILELEVDPTDSTRLPTGARVPSAAQRTRYSKPRLSLRRTDFESLRGTAGVRQVDEWKCVVGGVNVYTHEEEAR